MRRRTKLTAGAVAVLALAGASVLTGPSAWADDLVAPSVTDWGTVVPGGARPQADAWIAKVRGMGPTVDSALFESHYPGIPQAPETEAGGKGLVDLVTPKLPGPGIGVGSALYTKAIGNALPASEGAEDVPFPGAAYAQAGGASIDVGFPYLPSPLPESVSLSPWGLHLDGIEVEATAKPGLPVEFSGRGPASGYISSYGIKVIDVPTEWPPNFGARIPADHSEPAIAQLELNEQVTVDSEGYPTVDASGNYVFDPTAASGYVNAGHATVLGMNAADVTIGHAAVLGQE
jgi:hypothetical protein